MTVTEFALFKLRDTYDAVELLELVMECQEVQDEWVRANHPNACAKKASVSRMYIDESEAGAHQVFITAPWQSPDTHREWIDTAQNKAIMAKFAAFLPEGGAVVPNHDGDHDGHDGHRQQPAMSPMTTAAPTNTGFLFFHMDPAGHRAHLHEAFFPNERLTVTRLAAQGAGGREQLQARYKELEDALAAESPKDRIWGGWRIEKETGQEELVVFRNNDLATDQLAPLRQYGKVISRELRIAEIAPEPNR